MGHFYPAEVVDQALELIRSGSTITAAAAEVGVPRNTVQRWKRVYLLEGRARGQAHCQLPCPRCTGSPLDEAAYAELLGWYLGDGHIARARRGVWVRSSSAPCTGSIGRVCSRSMALGASMSERYVSSLGSLQSSGATPQHSFVACSIRTDAERPTGQHESLPAHPAATTTRGGSSRTSRMTSVACADGPWTSPISRGARAIGRTCQSPAGKRSPVSTP